MVRKRKQREEDGSGKQTAFNLHGRNVRIDKVNRFEKALSKRRPEGTGEANHVEAGMYIASKTTGTPANFW